MKEDWFSSSAGRNRLFNSDIQYADSKTLQQRGVFQGEMSFNHSTWISQFTMKIHTS